MTDNDTISFLIFIIIFLISLYIAIASIYDQGYRSGLKHAKDIQIERIFEQVKGCNASFIVIPKSDAEFISKDNVQ